MTLGNFLDYSKGEPRKLEVLQKLYYRTGLIKEYTLKEYSVRTIDVHTLDDLRKLNDIETVPIAYLRFHEDGQLTIVLE